MALIHRLFQNSREKRRSTWGCGASKKEQNFDSPEVLASYKCWQAPVLEENQIRLLIFKECDVKGKKILIDSKAIHKVDQKTADQAKASGSSGGNPKANNLDSKTKPKATSPHHIVDGYQFKRHGSDTKMLGEMLFGSIPMSSNGPIIKVHTFKMPPKLMLSKMFLLKPPKEQQETDGCDKDTISLYGTDMTIPRSISATSLPAVEIARSLPIAMPASPAGKGLDDSGEFSASGSFMSPFPPSPGSSVSSSASNGSLHRRWLRNQVTSMENVVRRRSSENISNTDEPFRTRKRYPKISVAVMFRLPEDPRGKEDEEFRRFFFSHFSLVESHFQRLVSAIERALIFQRKAFIRPVMEAFAHFKQTVTQLYTAPRIQRPIWLNLMTYPQQRGQLCVHLIKELGTLLEAHNSKQNNFFMSRLMTGVLMHHLAWVPTVMPAGSTPSRAFLDKHSSTTLDMLAKSHPYNPLWAQLGDMYGMIGLPNRVTKTVIVGKRADVVCRLLFVLSYFLRCSEVHEINEKCKDIVMDHESKSSLLDSCEKVERRRTITEDSGLAKTEDSGIEDVGFQNSENGAKPMFYIQDPIKCNGTVMPAETSSDDGVGFESELQSQCIQEDKCNRINVSLSQSCKARMEERFEESDEVFAAETETETESRVKLEPQVQMKIETRTNPGIETEVPVKLQSAINCQNGNNNETPVIMCKTLDTSMLVSKVELATPVGRSVRNIDDFLRFDVDGPSEVNPKRHVRGSGDVLPCRTLFKDETQQENHETPANSTASQKCAHTSVDSPTHRDSKQALNHNYVLGDVTNTNKVVANSSRATTDSMDIASNPSQRATVSNQNLNCKQCTSNASANNPTSCREHLSAKEHYKHIQRLGTEECMKSHERTELLLDKSPLYCRSTSSMSAVSCASSAFSNMSDHTCLEHEELPLASSEPVFQLELEETKSHVDNFGRSLLGGYCQHFVPDFALQGVTQLDVRQVEKNLLDSAQHPVLDDAMSEAVYLVADTDRWTVDVMSCKRFQGSGERPSTQGVEFSILVDQLLESVMQLQKMRLSADFCLMHLEDRLQELYFQSASVTRYLENQPMVKKEALAGAVNVDCSDLPLLLAVASVHSPQVIAKVIEETIEQQQRLAGLQDSP